MILSTLIGGLGIFHFGVLRYGSSDHIVKEVSRHLGRLPQTGEPRWQLPEL